MPQETGGPKPPENAEEFIEQLKQHGCKEAKDFILSTNYPAILLSKHLTFILQENKLLPINGNLIKVAGKVLLSPDLQEFLVNCLKPPLLGWRSASDIIRGSGGYSRFLAYLDGLPAGYLSKLDRRPCMPAGSKLTIYYSPKIVGEFRKYLGKPPLEDSD